MRILTLVLLLINAVCFGQKKKVQHIASTLSIDQIKKDLYYLASDKLEGRVMGSKGDTLASEYVGNCFRENRLIAPYNNGTNYFQTVNTFKKDILQSELNVAGRKYENWNGWSFAIRSTETVQLDNIPVVFAGYGIESSLYNDFSDIDVKGKAVLLLIGQPRDSSGTYLLSGTKQAAIIASYQSLLRKKGPYL